LNDYFDALDVADTAETMGLDRILTKKKFGKRLHISVRRNSNMKSWNKN